MTTHPSVLITGASTGIGAVYADRFAKRGHDLVLVARDRARMEALAERLRRETEVKIDILQADLTDAAALAQVEARLHDDARIGVLVNNAGASAAGTFIDQSPDQVAEIISLNSTALTRLASAVAPRFVAAGQGAIINIGSVVGLAPEFGLTVYGATKAFVLFLTQGLHLELGPKGVYVEHLRWRSAGDVPEFHAIPRRDPIPLGIRVSEVLRHGVAATECRDRRN